MRDLEADDERKIAAGGGAVAELAVGVVTPGNDLALGAQSQAVVTACRHSFDGHVAGQLDFDGAVRARGGAVAELAIGVGAPGQDLAGSGEGQGVEAAGAEGLDPGVLGQLDLDWHPAALGAAIAQLAIAVETPGQEPSGRGEREAELAARPCGGNRSAPGQPDLDRGTAALGAAVAQLAVAVETPGQDLAGRGDSQAVGAACRGLIDRRMPGQLNPHWCVTAGGAAVA